MTCLLSLPSNACRERLKKKKKKQEKQLKGKAERKGAAKSSSSSKSPAKSTNESFKSKEFVSSDESSSAESKKEVGPGGQAVPAHPGGLCRAPSPSCPCGAVCWYLWGWVAGLRPAGHHYPRVPAVGRGGMGAAALTSFPPAGLGGGGGGQRAPQLGGVGVWLGLACPRPRLVPAGEGPDGPRGTPAFGVGWGPRCLWGERRGGLAPASALFRINLFFLNTRVSFLFSFLVCYSLYFCILHPFTWQLELNKTSPARV